MNMEGKSLPEISECSFSLPDRYIFSRLQETINNTQTALNTFRFDLATQALYDFVWREFCDWYLELSKPLLQHEDMRVQNGARYTLIHVLDAILRLLHPMIPFITEELWQKLATFTKPALPSLMLMDYPVVNQDWVDAASEKDMQWVQDFILVVRNIRGEMNIAPKLPLSVLIKQGTEQDAERYAHHQQLINKLANLSSVTFVEADFALPESASGVLGHLELFVPLEGLIDKEAEKARLQKQLEKLSKEHLMLSSKLANEGYIARAPKDIVERDRARVAELAEMMGKIRV
jgi:valyl-tRNA synthetase